MHIDWGTLAMIAVVAAAAALTLVLLVAFAVVGMSAGSREPGAAPEGGGASGTRPALGVAVSALCVLAAGTIVCYGLYLIVA